VVPFNGSGGAIRTKKPKKTHFLQKALGFFMNLW
jgi:hypothetical protein